MDFWTSIKDTWAGACNVKFFVNFIRYFVWVLKFSQKVINFVFYFRWKDWYRIKYLSKFTMVRNYEKNFNVFLYILFYFLSSNMLYFNVPVFYHYPVYFLNAVFKILHSFTSCTDDETSISKRDDNNFTNRLRFNFPNPSAIQAKQSSLIIYIYIHMSNACIYKIFTWLLNNKSSYNKWQ